MRDMTNVPAPGVFSKKKHMIGTLYKNTITDSRVHYINENVGMIRLIWLVNRDYSDTTWINGISFSELSDVFYDKVEMDNLTNGYRFSNKDTGNVPVNIHPKDLLDTSVTSHDWAYINAVVNAPSTASSTSGFVKRVRSGTNLMEVQFRPYNSFSLYANYQLGSSNWTGWHPLNDYGYTPAKSITLTSLPIAPQGWEYIILGKDISPHGIDSYCFLRVMSINSSRAIAEVMSPVDGKTYTRLYKDGAWSDWRVQSSSDDIQIRTKPTTDRPETYPDGLSIMIADATYPNPYATVITNTVSGSIKPERTVQTVTDKQGNMWVRSGNAAETSGWSGFVTIAKEKDMVKLTGDQTVQGVKNFKDGIKINDAKLIDVFYPVGSIYQSIKPTNPSTFMGGTWSRINGKFLVGVNGLDPDFGENKTGGTKTNTLALDNLPAYADVRSNAGTGAGYTNGTVVASGWRNGPAYDLKIPHSQPVNNLPPYQTVFMWERIA